METYQASYEVWIGLDTGQRIFLAEEMVKDFRYAKAANKVGAFSLILPRERVQDEWIKLDGTVEIWRGVPGQQRRLEFVGLMRKFIYHDDREGNTNLKIIGPEVSDLLNRRIVAYAAGSSQAAKTDNADDLIKAIVRENLGASAPAGRNMGANRFYVTGDHGLAPSVSKKFAWRNMLDVIREICEISRQKGTELYFTVDPYLTNDNLLKYSFLTHVDQIGADRTIGTRLAALFGRDLGNLASPWLEYDYMNEITFVYAAGQGEGDDREVEEVEDTTRSGASIWNRREIMTDGRHLSDSTGLTDRGQGALEKGRPLIRFSGLLLDTPQTRYGIDWNYGDKVTAWYKGDQFDGMVKALQITVDQYGKETLEARLEVDL